MRNSPSKTFKKFLAKSLNLFSHVRKNCVDVVVHLISVSGERYLNIVLLVDQLFKLFLCCFVEAVVKETLFWLGMPPTCIFGSKRDSYMLNSIGLQGYLNLSGLYICPSASRFLSVPLLEKGWCPWLDSFSAVEFV
jgi:hypothetical protein